MKCELTTYLTVLTVESRFIRPASTFSTGNRLTCEVQCVGYTHMRDIRQTSLSTSGSATRYGRCLQLMLVDWTILETAIPSTSVSARKRTSALPLDIGQLVEAESECIIPTAIFTSHLRPAEHLLDPCLHGLVFAEDFACKS